ncbi:MAG TPA: hypothetical protein ENH24_00075, partial [Nitrospirae bacterium]|nr:hypothetical protein [Nitrospirota bacterium]
MLAPSTLSNWVRAYKAGKLEEVGKNHRPLSDRYLELARLKQELKIPQYEEVSMGALPSYTLNVPGCDVRDGHENYRSDLYRKMT